MKENVDNIDTYFDYQIFQFIALIYYLFMIFGTDLFNFYILVLTWSNLTKRHEKGQDSS